MKTTEQTRAAYLIDREGRNYTKSSILFASSNGGAFKPPAGAGHFIAVRATHFAAVGGCYRYPLGGLV